MPYDEQLASRIRDVLRRRRHITETKMFGGIFFRLRGHVLVGVWKDALMANIGLDACANATREPHIRQFMAGRKTIKGWVLVGPAALTDPELLTSWIDQAMKHVRRLPAK